MAQVLYPFGEHLADGSPGRRYLILGSAPAPFPRLGLDRQVVSDEMGFQGLVDYRTMRTAREAYDRFRALGVTHVLWMDGNEPGLLMQRTVVFNALVRPLTATHNGRYTMVELPTTPPAARPPYRVLTLGMSGLPDGIYPVDVLSRCELRPATECIPPRAEVPLAGRATADVLDLDVDAVMLAPTYPTDRAVIEALSKKFLPTWDGGAYRLFVKP